MCEPLFQGGNRFSMTIVRLSRILVNNIQSSNRECICPQEHWRQMRLDRIVTSQHFQGKVEHRDKEYRLRDQAMPVNRFSTLTYYVRSIRQCSPIDKEYLYYYEYENQPPISITNIIECRGQIVLQTWPYP